MLAEKSTHALEHDEFANDFLVHRIEWLLVYVNETGFGSRSLDRVPISRSFSKTTKSIKGGSGQIVSATPLFFGAIIPQRSLFEETRAFTIALTQLSCAQLAQTDRQQGPPSIGHLPDWNRAQTPASPEFAILLQIPAPQHPLRVSLAQDNAPPLKKHILAPETQEILHRKSVPVTRNPRPLRRHSIPIPNFHHSKSRVGQLRQFRNQPTLFHSAIPCLSRSLVSGFFAPRVGTFILLRKITRLHPIESPHLRVRRRPRIRPIIRPRSHVPVTDDQR